MSSMHTVVFGWFGASAVWFIPLLLRLAKSVLPGGAGLRGPGTIRLWLGFVGVFAASATLEALLPGTVGTDGFGHALAAGFGRLLGHIGTPLVMLGVLVLSLPWLIGFRWSRVARWADGAFGLGLGLNRGLAKRDEDARRRSSVDDTLPAYASTPANPMAPKTKGRYARPTVWRPSAGARGAAAGTGAAAGAVVGAKDALAGEARANAASGGAARQARNTGQRGQAAPADSAGATRVGTPGRQAGARTAATEPVAPAGWLREPGNAVRSAAPVRSGVAAAPAAGAGATTSVPRTFDASRTIPDAASGSRPSPNRSPSIQPFTTPVRTSAPPLVPRNATPAAPIQTPPPVAGAAPTPQHPVASGARAPSAPSFSRPAATTEHVTPPASVQETLRSIEENAARWTTIAGVSLARRSGAETVSISSDADTPLDEPAVNPTAASKAPPVDTPITRPNREAAVSVPATTSLEPAAPVDISMTVQVSAPLEVQPHAPASAFIEAVPHDHHSIVATPPANVDHPGAASATRTPTADVVIDKPLAPWETEVDTDADHRSETSSAPEHVVPEPAPAPVPSNVVRFPGFAATSVGRIASGASHGSQTPFDATADDFEDTPFDHGTTPGIPPDISETESEDDGEGQSDTPIASASAAASFTPPRSEPANEPVAPRPPVSGHAPAVFEFHAPAASRVELPTLDLLARADTDVEPVSEQKLAETGLLIEQRLQEFKVPVTVVGASAGPVITRFEVEPALGVRGSQIVGLMKDLSRGLGLTSIRVVETIPGKTCMGLELPNAKRQTIRLSEILEANVYQHSHSMLTLAMGKDITGHPVVADLAKAPHMLVAGTTGSGKSVAINAMIVSLLYKATPEDVRLIMIDPKMLELSVYEGIPHLLAPVVTDMKLAANALNWCVGEMEKRYRLMSAVGVRNLAGFNQKIRDAKANGKKLGNPFSLTPEAPEPLAALPLIVVVIDELADLMMVAGKKIEELIARLAQKARAAGIHLILATQRPSVDVITGLIKANIPTRVAFQVSSKIDSRTILDQMGAESLLGQGDMLFLPPGTGYPQRVHGAFVADEEVHRIVEYLKQFGEPQYEEGILDGPTSDGATQDLFGDVPDAEADPLYDEAVAFVVRTRRASISSVQRQLRIGYNRAARLVEQMEAAGLVSSMGINGSREVLAPGPAE